MNASGTTGPISLSLFRVARERQSYTNMLYLLLSFPLGLAYFVFLVTGIVLGLGTLIIWIGAFILLFMMIAWRYLAAFERRMAIDWLHVVIPPLFHPYSMPTIQWQRLQALVRNSMTWKTLAYLLLKFPLGLFSFVITIVLAVLSFVIALVSLILGLLSAPFVILVLSLQGASYVKEFVQRYLLFALTGFGLSLVTLHLLNGLAFVAGQLARLLLGMSDTAWRMEEARALAIQERTRAELAEQRRHQLVVNVSHELRSPIASIAGHIESLLIATDEGTTAPPPATLYNYLTIAHQEVERLGMLVDDLLSLARMESNELRLDMKEVQANETIEEVYQTLMPLALRQRQVTLVRGAAPHLPAVMADRQRLRQVLLNLARNAITSTPAGGIVSLNLEQADAQHLALVVADSGAGIPAEELEHIFERFYRVDSSRTRATGGFGLGLTIVHDLVMAMGGSMRVESTVGQGSRFCVLLRIATPRSHPL
ncbi:MAG TPA: sensor domain-containing protein [Ktedonobacteraceae bacterium]